MKDNLDKDAIHSYMILHGKDGYAVPRQLRPDQRAAYERRKRIELMLEEKRLRNNLANGWDL